jgi:hypothetical protein
MGQAVTREEVIQIVGEMTARGDSPTVKAVRVAIGNRGSFATLVPWVREAKAALAVVPLLIDNPLVRAVEALKPGVWAELLRTAKDEVAEQLGELQQIAIERAAETDALAAERIEQDAVAEQLRADLAATQAERTTALDALHVVAEIAAAVVAVQASVDQVTSRLAEVEAGMERQVAGLNEQLSAGLAHLQEQMTAEQVAAAARSEQVRSTVQTSVVDQVAQLTASITGQLASLTVSHRNGLVATKKAITGLSAATRIAALATKEYR